MITCPCGSTQIFNHYKWRTGGACTVTDSHIIFIAPLSFFMQIWKRHYRVVMWLTGCFSASSLLSYSATKYLHGRVRNCQTPPHTTGYVRYCHLTVFSPQRHTGPSSAEKGAWLHHLFPGFTSFKVIRAELCETHGSRGVARLLLTVCYQAADVTAYCSSSSEYWKFSAAP